MEDILLMEDITKIYGGVTALNHVNFSLRRGEIMAVVGENGAGKSTLIKTLSGAVIPDAGKIVINGKEFSELTPSVSKEMGIAIVYQELNLCASLKVYENIFLGSFIGKAGFVNKIAMREKAVQLLKENELNIDPDIQVSALTVAQMQLVEIAKAISKDTKILVLDEPTGTLTASETEILFKLIKRLKNQGTSIIYISHRLSEIFAISDRVTIMRDGHVISTHKTSDIDETQLVHGMIGRELTKSYPPRKCEIGGVLLKVEDLSGEKSQHINFELHSGEVLGIGGLVGAGRTELVRVIFGADQRLGGNVILEGKTINPKSPQEAMKKGIALVPEDRKGQGVVLGLPIQNNICLSIYRRISQAFFVNRKREKEIVSQQILNLKIKTPNEKQLTGNLSGGNQQKVVLGKCLASKQKVLILDEPTRGIDVGAKYEFYKIINDLAARGIGIIMVSSEMDELLGMSDRVLVMSEGKLAGEISRSEFSQERVFNLATKYSASMD